MQIKSVWGGVAFATGWVLLAAAVCPAAPRGKITNPDFTAGGKIPAGVNHFWNLGATGARGWMYSKRLCTSEARQIAITEVVKGSPAEGVLAKGDVILGVGGKKFSYDPRTEFGKALSSAEVTGRLSLIRWRDGKQSDVVVKLPVLGAYSATAPYNCPKSSRILKQGCEALAKRMADPKYTRQNPIPRCLNGLGLLASGDSQYHPLVKKEAEWAAAFKADRMATWYYGYITIFLSEYVMATGDDSVLPGLKRLCLEAAEGQSIVGSWGHRFAGPDGRLVGYGMMNSPGVPLTTGLILARKAGVKDPKVDRAIERSAKLIRFYIGKGAVPYGDHHPWTQTHEDNGKCGMAAVMFSELGEAKGAEYFSRMSLASHGAERDTGHTGNYFNITWAMPGVALSGPQSTGAWMKEFGAWYYDLARRHDGTFVHLGPPQAKRDAYGNWDATGVYLLAYAMPLKKLHLTGKGSTPVPQLTRTKAKEVIEAGRGWSNLDRNSYYDKLSESQLLERLGSWSPTVRKRAAMALKRRKAKVIPTLIEMLDASRVEARIGACEALAMFKKESAPAVSALIKALDDQDMWLRIKAAEALAAIGDPAMKTVPKLLKMLAKGPTPKDPRGMEQRYLMFSVFGQMLRRSLDGVDKALLRKAVAAGLHNQDGRARGAAGNIYKQLSYEEIKPLLPAIHEAIVKPSPSGIMFASGIRLAGVEVLARHKVKEGMALCLEVMEIHKWGKRGRIGRCLKILGRYGAAAKAV
ncbi:MAG: DUF6288 domain-containing protein, partial [Phycisphaeraceae bacterium]|nr:DUF6288 domain-containing protein [Phycisphaeraceae bacterium]